MNIRIGRAFYIDMLIGAKTRGFACDAIYIIFPRWKNLHRIVGKDRR